MQFEIKDKVKLIVPVSYLKTSDNMPMLRPPDLVAIDEIGEILSIRKEPLLNFTSTVFGDFIDRISPISSRATKSGGLSIGILSEVFRKETGAINLTLSFISNSIKKSNTYESNISTNFEKISTK